MAPDGTPQSSQSEPAPGRPSATQTPLRVAITGATGLVGTRLVAALRRRDHQVRALVRSPERARSKLPAAVELFEWDPQAGPAPLPALAGCDAVVHLAGEPLAQRWSGAVKQRIRDSRVVGTANLVAAIAAIDADERPRALVSASGIDYYGPRHPDDEVDESAPPGGDFLAELCVAWEAAATAAADHGVRVARLRTAVALDRSGGALAQMLTPFRLGLGGPIAGGAQPFPWIHLDDLVGLYLAAIEGGPEWSGPINAVAPEAVSNRAFTRALGRALHRPAIAPLPALALRVRFGEMATLLTTGVRAVPRRAQELDYRFEHPSLDEALAAALRD